jgi:hypothetical protein
MFTVISARLCAVYMLVHPQRQLTAANSLRHPLTFRLAAVGVVLLQQPAPCVV